MVLGGTQRRAAGDNVRSVCSASKSGVQLQADVRTIGRNAAQDLSGQTGRKLYHDD